MFSYLEIDNLLKANEKLKLSIIQESDKMNIFVLRKIELKKVIFFL